MRYFFTLMIGLYMLAGMPAVAAPSLEQYYNSSAPEAAAPVPAVPPAAPEPVAEPAGSGSHVVTSVKGCLKEIGAEAAAEIRRTSLTPYADCQRVRAAQAKAAADAKKAAAVTAPVAETPRNFRRVTDPAAPEKAPESPPTDVKKPK